MVCGIVDPMESVSIIFIIVVELLITDLRALPLDNGNIVPDLTSFDEYARHQLIGMPTETPFTTDPPHLRHKRFLTPTTYPVPTKPIVTITPDRPTVLTGSSLFLNSRPVNCPVKRSVRRKRIVLNQDIMRDLYLHLVGDYDTTLMAETIEEAENNFVPLPISRNSSSSLDKNLYKDIIKLDRWFNAVKTNLNSNNYGEEIVDFSLEDILETLQISKTQLQHLLSIRSSMDLVTSYHSSHRRVKRAASTPATPQGSFCVQRGTKTKDGFLHLCTACAYTKQLPSDRYPQYINEAACDKSDCNCFTVNGHHHGKCVSTVHHVKLLKRKKNGCRLMIQNGKQLILDDWELYDQPIRGGCECLINKNSPYARLVSRPAAQHG